VELKPLLTKLSMARYLQSMLYGFALNKIGPNQSMLKTWSFYVTFDKVELTSNGVLKFPWPIFKAGLSFVLVYLYKQFHLSCPITSTVVGQTDVEEGRVSVGSLGQPPWAPHATWGKLLKVRSYLPTNFSRNFFMGLS